MLASQPHSGGDRNHAVKALLGEATSACFSQNLKPRY